MRAQVQYSDGYWWSKDNLRLHFRDYAGDERRPPIICIPGLTRNASDFASVAARLAPTWRVICVDLRGRGESAYAKDSMTYAPLTYVQDIDALLDKLGIKRFVAFGTSLGGLVTMLLASTEPGRIAGALLNDIGPVSEARGIDRIKSYVGKSQSWPTWVHAARSAADLHGAAHPHFDLLDWIAHAKRLYRLTPMGKIMPDYDLRIAEALRMPAGEFDMWPAYEALGTVPLLITRGALSDVFAAETAQEMITRLRQAQLVTVPEVGHAPLLVEPLVVAAIDEMLAAVCS
ncbi:MAG: alpha/beta fold hydrolase [Sphingomonadaceae bacterium]